MSRLLNRYLAIVGTLSLWGLSRCDGDMKQPCGQLYAQRGRWAGHFGTEPPLIGAGLRA